MKVELRSMRALRCAAVALVVSLASGAHAAPVAAQGAGAADALSQLEMKWGAVMRRIKGWDDAALQQFRDGYRNYPVEVLQQALAARTFEEMSAVLDAHAATQAQKTMAKAYPVGATVPEDANNPQVVEAKNLAAKVLGDDARDLVFIPVTPCTVWDTRYATNPASFGVIADGVTKRFYSHMDGSGGSYAAYGGNPSCPETAQNALGGRPYAVMMTAYVNDATANGWLTFYRDGDPDPSLGTISVYYSPGPTRTQTVISKSSRGYGTGAYDVAVTGRYGSANAAASVVGYFMKAVMPTTSAIATTRLSGNIGSPIAQSSTYVFIGPTANITTTATQRITGSAMVPIGVTTGSVQLILDFCYRTAGTTNGLTNSAGFGYSYIMVDTSRAAQAVSGTFVPGAGTWQVGVCVASMSGALNNNDYLNAYFQVTN